MGVTSQLADLRGDHGLCCLREIVTSLGFPETLMTRELVPRDADEPPFGDRISLVLECETKHRVLLKKGDFVFQMFTLPLEFLMNIQRCEMGSMLV